MRNLIIVVSILVLAATAATIMIGMQSFDGVVVEKPYETGLAWDAARENRTRLGWAVALAGPAYHAGVNELVLNVSDKNGAPIHGASVSVTIARPSSAAYDRIYPASPRNGGGYRASVDLPLFGNWDVIIAIQRGSDRMAVTQSILVERNK